jgi:multiple sugar transport system substrate-binding protein
VPGGNAGTYQAYSNQIIAGNTGDIGMVEYPILPSYRLQQGLVNIASCPGVAEARSQFTPASISASEVGDLSALFGIPQDVGPLGLYYRKDLFAKYHIAVPATWDQFAAAAPKVKAAGGHIAGFQYGQPGWLEGLAWQAGARWFTSTDKGWIVNMTDAASLKVASYWTMLVRNGYVAQEDTFSPADWSDLGSGKLWTLIAPPWMSVLLATNSPDSAGDWAVAPLPQWTAGQARTGMWGGSDYVVWSTCKYPAQAAQFLLWLETSQNALTVNNTVGGQFPGYMPAVRTVPAMAGPLTVPSATTGKPVKYFGDQVIWNVFTGMHASPSWQAGPTQSETDADLGTALAAFISGSGTIADALRATQAKTIAAIQAQGLTVVQEGSH